MPLTVNDLIPFVVVGAAAVTALSTIAGVRLANQAAERQLKLRLNHQDEKDHKEALRVRLEELYQLIDIWAGKVVIHHTTYRRVMDGLLTYNQALDAAIESESFNSARLFTLADLYFPFCHDVLDRIKASRDEMADIQHSYKELYRENGPTIKGAKYSEVLTEKLIQFNSAIDQYKSSLSEYAREV